MRDVKRFEELKVDINERIKGVRLGSTAEATSVLGQRRFRIIRDRLKGRIPVLDTVLGRRGKNRNIFATGPSSEADSTRRLISNGNLPNNLFFLNHNFTFENIYFLFANNRSNRRPNGRGKHRNSAKR